MAFPSTFLDIRTMVENGVRLLESDDASKVKDWINLAYAEAAEAVKWFEGSSAGAALAAGASSQAIPATILELEDVTCTYAGISPPLRQISWEELLYRRQYGSQGGPPIWYSVRKANVEFHPTAQGAEILTYYGSMLPTSYLASDSDVPDFPEPFSTNLLYYGACVKAAEFKNDLMNLGGFQQSYAQWLGRFQAFLNKREGTGSLAFPVYPGPPSVGSLPHDRSSDWYAINGY